ncbi:MAG: hypothetical protein HDR88_00235 [Bacteroides sp.]|nr:hypothetical protein [Bacteroides sp.]
MDLGLPSGLKWATCNAGATLSSDYGDYMIWSESNTSFDAPWRLPSINDFKELINVCSWKWVIFNDHAGYKITGPNGKSMFLPAGGCFGSVSYGVEKAGDYWTSAVDHSSNELAYGVELSAQNKYIGVFPRNCGYSIRGVLKYLI